VTCSSSFNCNVNCVINRIHSGREVETEAKRSTIEEEAEVTDLFSLLLLLDMVSIG